jgi:hypothetical protein
MGVFMWALVGAIAVFAVARKRIFSRLTRGHVKPSAEFAPVADSVRGKRVLVVGGTKGLGLALATKLAKEGADVTVAGRTRPAGDLKFLPADLQKVKDQKKFAESIDAKSLDLLVFTQGILAPPTRQDNGEGIELDLAVSYISRKVILDTLREKGLKARVFVMGFPGEDQGVDDFNGLKNYAVWAQHMVRAIWAFSLLLFYSKQSVRIEYGDGERSPDTCVSQKIPRPRSLRSEPRAGQDGHSRKPLQRFPQVFGARV